MSFSATMQRARHGVIRTVVTTTAVLGAVEVTTHLPSQGRASALYHALADEVGTPLLRLLLDAESAHNAGVWLAKQGLTPLHRISAAEQRVSLEQTLFGGNTGKSSSVTFANPVGLAAGFDKHGEILQPMLDLGFGFVELGSVTPLPQPGNPQPRMFRLTADQAVINRYGFNSHGATAVRKRLQHFRQEQQQQPSSSSSSSSSWLFLSWLGGSSSPAAVGPVGVNVGKNKETPQEEAARDYVATIQELGPYADYLVVNVSSPNTAGLRNLQQADTLRSLLRACLDARNALDSEKRPPLLVKLAPDLTTAELHEIADVCLELAVDGIIVETCTIQTCSPVRTDIKEVVAFLH